MAKFLTAAKSFDWGVTIFLVYLLILICNGYQNECSRYSESSPAVIDGLTAALAQANCANSGLKDALYQCFKNNDPTKIHMRLVCEGSSINISCSTNHVIHIIFANYGRTEPGYVCPHTSIQTTNCSATTSMSVVNNRCEGHNSCSVTANNNAFGDPCVNTYKYLEIVYICVENDNYSSGYGNTSY